MGTYDDLLTLQRTPTVASAEPPKKAETLSDTQTLPPAPKQPVKTTRKVQESHRSEPQPMMQATTNKRRITTRGSFEVYEDQLNVLRQVSLTARLTGEDLSISEMVREALDEYIHRKNLRP
jgi:hypothetical protein